MICVLHVDDSSEDRTLTNLSLKRVSDDIKLLEADCGNAAIEVAKGPGQVDCIISDYQMPGMNGMELLKTLRADGIGIPFVLLTGQGNEQVAVEALREGADDYFTKEVGFANYNRLVNTIKNVVDKYQHNQKRKEAEKQASIFKTISDKANYGNAIADPEGNIIYSNNAFAAIHQYPQDELTGMNLSEFIDGKESFLAELKNKSFVEAMEVWHQTRGGDLIPLLINASMVEDEDANPIYISLNTIDVSQRKKDEETLKNNKERLRDLLDHVNDIIYTHDLDGNFTSVNHSVNKVFGYTEKEILGKNLRDIVHPRYIHLVFKEIAKEEQGRRFKRNNEILIYDKLGNKKYVEINFRLVRKPGAAVEILGIARDISEKRSAIKRIKEAKEQYKDLVEKAGIAILIDTMEGGFEYFNETFNEIFGYRKEEIIDMTIEDLVHPEDYDYVNKFHNRRVYGEKSPSRYEFRGIRKGGDTIYLEVDAVPIVRANKIIGTRSYLWDITDRKLVEKEAEKHKVYFETLIEHAPEAIVIQNTDGIIANINNEFVRTFGFDREESIGKHIDELITPEGFLKESKMLSQMVFDEGKIYAETRRSTKTGEMINVSILAAPIEINNQLQGHYTIFRDITQKKHNEEELARYRKGLEELVSLRTEELNKINRELSESREEYKLLAENVTDNIFILDLKSRRYSYSSPSIEMITGFTPEDIKTKYMNELFERNSYLLAKKMILEELKRYRDISGPKKGNEIVELQHLTVNGGYVWVEVTGKLMCDSSGKPDRILCTMRDISERKRSQELIRRTEEKYRKIIDESPLSIIISDVSGKIIKANPSSVKMFGYSDQEITLMYYDELTWPEDMGLEDKGYKQCLEGKKDNYFIEKRYMNKKKRPFWANLSVSIIRDDDGNPLNFITMIENINKRKKAEFKLESSRKYYKDLLDLLPQTVFESDLEGNITYVNKGGFKTFGYQESILKEGINISDILVPGDLEFARSNILSVINGEESKGNKYTACRAGGEEFPLLLYSVAIFDEGKPVALRGLGVDLSTQEGVIQGMQARDLKHYSLFENARDAVFIVNKSNFKILIKNNVACEFVNDPSVVGCLRGGLLLKPELSLAVIPDEILKKLESSERFTREINCGKDSEGKIKSLHLTFSNVNFEKENGALIIIRSVEERAKPESQELQ